MAHAQPSPPGGVPPPHGHMAGHPSSVNGHLPVQSVQSQPPKGPPMTTAQKITALNEQVWLQIGSLSELMGDLDGAMGSYEHALRHNQWSIPAMSAIAQILRTREQFPKAIEYLQTILKLDPQNGEAWSNLGHCHLMMDNLQEAYTSYQQALYHLRDPKEPKLWYGIGILYDRYGSLEHAEEAFSQVMHMAPDFEKANEIYFRLGIIYKQQQKYQQSLDCFKYIVNDPPRPLTEEDIYFQIGHVYEQQKDFENAQAAYRRVLEKDPNHAKVLQQLGWLYHQQSNSYASQEKAIEYLEKSVNADNSDAQSWYLLGRCYMSQQKYSKAYEAYQQAVYRDGRNPTFWCSIGVLYYQINQYRDALDAYSRAIRLNPYISEVWYDLGTLYESCNNQTADALDAYSRAADLDPTNVHIKARLQLLQGQLQGQNQGNTQPPAPQDVHPQAYQAPGVGQPPAPQWGAPAPTGGPPPQAPAPPRQIADWNRGVNDLQNQPAASAYDHRGLPAPQHPSPRQEPPRTYEMGGRGQTATRSPKPAALPAPNHFQPSHTLPQISTQPGGDRPVNGTTLRAPPSNGAPAPGSHLAPYHRPFSPPTEIRPLREVRDERPSSPGASYPHQQYHPGPSAATNGRGGLSSGAPASDNRERDDRPTSAMKRSREWDGVESSPAKKIANDESRLRPDEHLARRMSPPREVRRRSSSDTRREEPRRGNENYHGSETPHPSLPSIQHLPQSVDGQGASSVPTTSAGPSPVKEESAQKESVLLHEPAARKMDVDENYDEDGEDEKRAVTTKSSPRGNGVTNGSSSQVQAES